MHPTLHYRRKHAWCAKYSTKLVKSGLILSNESFQYSVTLHRVFNVLCSYNNNKWANYINLLSLNWTNKWTADTPIPVLPDLFLIWHHWSQSFNNEKCPGWDNITNKVFKSLPIYIILLLTFLLNCCLNRHYFPKIFEHAIIASIPKSEADLTKLGNLRIISLLSTMGKLLERVILDRLNSWLLTKDILRNEQFGFRRYHNSTLQLLRVITIWES